MIRWLVVAALTGFAAPQESDIKKLFPDAEAVKKSAKKLSAESREKIEKAIEGKLDDKEATGAIWEFRALVREAHPTEKVRVQYTTVTAKGPKGDIRLGVAVAPEDRVIAGVLVIENKDDAGVAGSAFLEQFTRFSYTPSLAAPASTLAQLKAKAAERKDADSKQMDSIFRLHVIMHPVGTSWASLKSRLDKDDAKAAEDLDKLVSSFAESKKVAGDFAFLKGSSLTRFQSRLDEGAAGFRGLSSQVKAGKFRDALSSYGELEKSSCSACHAGTQRAFRERRNALGIGNGFVSVGFDVSAPSGPAASFEAAAAAIRRAALILSEAK